ncbi:MAG: bile acid:sodium symporter [Thermoplasmatales archaeon]
MTERSIARRIGLRTLLFPVFVVGAIFAGLLLGLHFRSESSSVATYGIPIGLFFMIYPAMAKVRLNQMGESIRNVRNVGLMVFLNYAIAPFLVAGIAYFFVYVIYVHAGILSYNIASQMLVGIILLGVAPCIAMVMVWTDLAHGNLPLGVSFVAWNSLIQIVTTPFLVYLLARTSVVVSPFLILQSVLFYLVLPMIAGIVTRVALQKRSYFSKVLNYLGYVQTIALLVTIVVIFWGEGYGILDTPSLVWMIGIVMLTFYFILFHLGYLISRKLGRNYRDATSIGFTVSARDFEISIAIALSAFSIYPYVGITTAIGPLLEIPLMLLLVLLQLRRERSINISRNINNMVVTK